MDCVIAIAAPKRVIIIAANVIKGRQLQSVGGTNVDAENRVVIVFVATAEQIFEGERQRTGKGAYAVDGLVRPSPLRLVTWPLAPMAWKVWPPAKNSMTPMRTEFGSTDASRAVQLDWSSELSQPHIMDDVIAALAEDEVGALAGGEDVFAQVDEVDGFPDALGHGAGLLVAEG